jgi:hypothetical protein
MYCLEIYDDVEISDVIDENCIKCYTRDHKRAASCPVLIPIAVPIGTFSPIKTPILNAEALDIICASCEHTPAPNACNSKGGRCVIDELIYLVKQELQTIGVSPELMDGV